jgi:hypothetical protein
MKLVTSGLLVSLFKKKKQEEEEKVAYVGERNPILKVFLNMGFLTLYKVLLWLQVG